LEGSITRILVVDDYAPWRRFVLTTLQKQQGLQIIGEAVDGLEAVQKARQLQPDLILLDIGLPILNGFEAARQIRSLSPASKIVFVTQESSADVVQEALNIGASGYVVKADAGRKLIAAVTTVLRGEQFGDRRFAGDDFTGTSNLRIPDAHSHKLVPDAVSASSSPTAPRRTEVAHRHEVQFYSDESFFLMVLPSSSGRLSRLGTRLSSSRPSHTGRACFWSCRHTAWI
jgi:DNA-binding NarL/FixJ family response regulator